MKSIQVEKVRDAVRDMCIEANYSLSPDMRCVFEKACQEEKSPLGRQILNQLSENLEIAKKDEIPICQDTGMAVVFLEVGQEVYFEGGSLEEAVQVCADKAESGDAVLLSPACASWGMFDNYEQRGRMFKDYVRALPE